MNILEGLTREKQKLVQDALSIYTSADNDVKAAIAKGTSRAERHIGKVVIVVFALGVVVGKLVFG